MVILLTSSSSSKTEFTRIFYDVFDVGGYAGSSRLEVSLLYILGILPTSRSLDAVGERSNFKKNPTHTQDHGDA